MDIETLEIITELIKDKKTILDIELENKKNNPIEGVCIQASINTLSHLQVDIMNIIIDTLQRQR